MYKPLEGSCRVWILDECHKMSNDAQNALLKALEDTAKHVYYILCTTEPNKLIKTIRGRCSQYQVNPLNDTEMKKLLRRVTKAEGQKLENDIYDQIIETATGHPRNALQILDQVLAVEPEERLEIAKRSADVQMQSIELCRALIKGSNWASIRKILNGLKGQEPETIRRQVLGYCSVVLLNDSNTNAGAIMKEMIDPFYDTGFPGLVFACYSIVKGEK
jgi:DNA polymerase III gamma/tau subunit